MTQSWQLLAVEVGGLWQLIHFACLYSVRGVWLYLFKHLDRRTPPQSFIDPSDVHDLWKLGVNPSAGFRF
jgi:hypothetical protein